MIDALAVVTPFHSTCTSVSILARIEWVTSLELATDPLLEKPQIKSLTLILGLYLSIGFCETNKDPIYEVEFFQKPPLNWIPLKISHSGLDVLGAYLCFKT